MARPRIYSDTWVSLVEKYIENKAERDELPTQSEVANMVLGCDEDTLTNYVQEKDESGQPKYPEFFGAVKKLRGLQKHMLLKKGLNKEWNAGMARFILCNNHKMYTKQEFQVVNQKRREPIEFYVVKPDDLPEEI